MDEKARQGISGFHFMATGIGSVPTVDVQEACLHILKHLSQIPFWPQLVKRSHLEDMSIQFSEGLPLLKVIADKGVLTVSSAQRETELVTFYDHFLAGDMDYFGVSRDYAPGLFTLVGLIQEHPEKYGPYIKGQTVGPVTFAAGIVAPDGKSVLYDPELLEAMVKGLSIKALWQVRELEKSGKNPIIFLDEPYLSGFGSAFSPIQRHEVIRLIKEVIDYLRERADTLIGIHCCGNTDWPMIIETGPDILNFDAFEHVDHFLLYPEEITRFLRGGGIIAWGIVPTASFTGKESVKDLYSKLEQGLSRLYEWGLDAEIVIRNSILTPACGMGTIEPALADAILERLSALSRKCAAIS